MLYKRSFLPSFVFTPIRKLIRFLSNSLLPYYFNKFEGRKGKDNKTNRKIIVSLTSFPKRINSVWLVVECLMRQTLMPNKILLWLSKEQFPSYDNVPRNLKERVSDIFEIRLVENDIRSHKKYYYAFQEFPNDYVITVDDDIFYPPYMIEDLVRNIETKKNTVVGRYGFEIKYNNDLSVESYNNWVEGNAIGLKNSFFGSGGGTLFIPSKLYKDTLNIELALNLCPLADDVWLNAMVRLANLSVYISSKEILLPISIKQNVRLTQANVYYNQNDAQIKALIDYYKDKENVNPYCYVK